MKRTILNLIGITLMLTGILLIISNFHPIPWLWIFSPIWEIIALLIIEIILMFISTLFSVIKANIRAKKEAKRWENVRPKK